MSSISAREVSANNSRRSRSARWVAAVVAAVSLAIALLRWNSLPTLLSLDTPMWLFQSARFAWGQLPYRDFNFNYPPLSIVMLGYWLRWFGVKFWVAALWVDLLGVANLVFFYRLGRRLMPPVATGVTMLFLLGICCTTTIKYGLLSFTTYSPSLLLASLGLVMILDAGIAWIRSGLRSSQVVVLAVGCFISLTSKPESMITAIGALALLILFDLPARKKVGAAIAALRYYLRLLAICVLPAVIFLSLCAAQYGLKPMLEGIKGYGLARQTCPWWPTGLGVFGGLSALGEAGFVLVLLSWSGRREFQRAHPWYRMVEFLALPGLVVCIAYYWVLTGSLHEEPRVYLEIIAGTSPILLMVMWPALVIALYLGIDWLRKRIAFTKEQQSLLFLVSVPSAVALRGLFGTTLAPVTEVSALCYPLFAFLGPYLVWLFITTGESSDAHPNVQMAFASVLLLYAAGRVVMAFPDQFDPTNYQTIQTEAGPVRLADYSGQVYQYIVEHSKPKEAILEFPLDGGLSFAAHRPSSTFSVQFNQLMMSRNLQERDAEGVRNNPPAFVIATPNPIFSTSYGIESRVKCTCPRIQFLPNEFPGIPGYVYPVVAQVRKDYHVVKDFGDVRLLAPIGRVSSTTN
jgi:hypothetical protein